MRGVGRATSAVTVINALPTGVGCALGIDLGAEVTVTLDAAAPGVPSELRIAADQRTPLVESAFRLAAERFLPETGIVGDLRIRSEIPVARGLKSSSAVASATVRAVAEALGARTSLEEVARLSARAGRASGVSATGAFDDALAGLRPGFVLTDNRTGSLLRTESPGADWEAAILVPPARHRPSPEWARAFAAEAARGTAAVEAARSGRWWEALARNTEIVERVMGYSYENLRAELLRVGALAAGVSGLGPALAAIAPSGQIPAVLEVLAHQAGERLRVRVNGSVATSEGRSP